MLLYEYQLRDQIENLREYANNVRRKFDTDVATSDLLAEAKNLRQIYDLLQDMLPKELVDCSNLGRHIGWMDRRLSEDCRPACKQDIEDICNQDIKAIETAFRKWCAKQDHYDSELAAGISKLVLRQELDSAVRKAFVILKDRLVRVSGAPSSIDGPGLVNQIFGSGATYALDIDDGDRQAFRDLLAGLYGVFRNKFAHENTVPSWAEADGIISMINLVLKDLDGLSRKPTK